MRKSVFDLGVILACLILAGGLRTEASIETSPADIAAPQTAAGSALFRLTTDPDFGRMPLCFIPNNGQMDGRVAYYVQGRDKAVYFGRDGVTFVLTQPEKRWAVKLDFLDANQNVQPVGQDGTGVRISYFKGNSEDWKTGLPTYSRIVYAGLWPGIDLVYSGTSNRLKYEFVVHPGADPSAIRLAYRGAETVAVNASGQLEVTTPLSSFHDDTPVAWQEAEGSRQAVSMSYSLETGSEPGAGKAVAFGFSVGDYDRSRPLVLDPAIIVYCGYIGGASSDDARAVAVDGSGCAYLTGRTSSFEDTFPEAVGPDLTYNSGTYDAYVAKVRADGTGLIYCGYIGGDQNDRGYGIAVDGSGCAYVTGYTESGQATFPETEGPDLTYNGIRDVFVAKVKADGTGLIYCGYIGGTGTDEGKGIAVDVSGHAYVTGWTLSDQTSFPETGGPDLTHNGDSDVFVAKVKADGTGLDYCGYIGGTNSDEGVGIAVDGSGRAYLVGYVFSSETQGFPVTVGPDLTFNDSPGETDVFVARVRADGTGLEYCGYIGGDDNEEGWGIALDGSGNAYVVGNTDSHESTFPVKLGPSLIHAFGSDGFVAKVKADGTGLDYCGFIGGDNYDYAQAVAVDGSGNAYIVGTTYSNDPTFPVTVGPDLTRNGAGDAYIAKLNPAGTAFIYCGYIGGADDDQGYGVTLDGMGNVYAAGFTESAEDTFPVAVGPDLSQNNSRDAFIAKINEGVTDSGIKVTSPNGGEKWEVGSQHLITWWTMNKTGADKIVYSMDRGASWKQIVFSTPDDGQFAWTVPNTVSRTCWVRVAEREGPGYDRSDKVFAIVPAPKITVVSPNGGEKWKAGTTHAIKWSWAGTVGPVKIFYSIDGGLNWTNIVASASNTGSYSWKVPARPSTKCLIRIWEASDKVPSDLSNSAFTILAASAN